MVAVSCSDSTIHFFSLNATDSTLELSLCTEVHPKHCPLSLCPISDDSLLSGSTGGELSLIVLKGAEKHKTRLSSGINSMAINDEGFIAIGEDGGTITILSAKDLEILEQLPNCHHSCITGLVWLDASRLISVSVDQRVKTWRWDSTERSIALIDSQMTAVPDVADVLLLPSHLLVVGSGLQLLDKL